MLYSSSRREFLRALAAALATTSQLSAEPPAFFRYPYVQDVRRSRATIRWTTRLPGDGEVEFWDDSQVRRRAPAAMKAFLPAETGMPAAYYRFESLLPALQPGTSYSYRVMMASQPVPSSPLSFHTPGTAPFQFLAFGDSGTGSPEQKQIAGSMLGRDAEFIVHTGDLVYPSGTYERYESLYFDYYRELMLDAPFFPCPGNHDYYETSCIPYRAIHSLPQENVSTSDYGRYYSFDWGNAHFVSLDSNDSLYEAATGSGRMLKWLEEDLRNTTKFWRVVIVHHPAYSAGKHSDEPESELVRRYVTPVLDKFSVPLVLNGHEHSYQRSAPITAGKVVKRGEGTLYITTGGGGADLHEVSTADTVELAVAQHHFLACNVTGSRLRIQALRPDGSQLDDVNVAPKPVSGAGKVVNSATYTTQLASGGLVSVFGFHFAADDITPLEYPLPKVAAGASVLLGDQPLPILMASGTQMNVQLPFDAVGPAELTIRTPNGTTTVPVNIRRLAPAVFEGAIFHSDGTAVSAEAPARAGQTLRVYLTGLGAADTTAVAGEAAPQAPALANVWVRWNGVAVAVEFAGLLKGTAGVNVVSFRVPSAGRPQASLQVVAEGIESNLLLVPSA
jgi:uncharacterized protein (TIGR03437 family)